MATEDQYAEFADVPMTGPDMRSTSPLPAIVPASTPMPAPRSGKDEPDPYAEFKDAPAHPVAANDELPIAPAAASPSVGGFADELPAQVSHKMTPEDESAYSQMLRTADAATLKRFLVQRGFTSDGLDEYVAGRDRARAAGTPVNYDVSYRLPKPIADDGAAMAGGRGFANGVTLGAFPRLRAAGQATEDYLGGKGFDYSSQLDQARGQEAYDLDVHPVAHVAGELLGGIAMPIGLEKAGLTATIESVGLAAGRDALREGLSMSEARAIAARAITKRIVAEGAAYGGAYGFNGSYGDPGERLLSAAGGAAEGAVGGAALGGVGELMAPRIAAVAANARTLPLSDAATVGQAADRQGINILPQDVGGPGIIRATQGTAQSTFGTSKIAAAADRLYGGFRDRVGQLADGAQPPVDAGNMVAGRSQQVAARNVAAAERTSGAVQDAVGTPVDVTGAGQAAQRGVSRFLDVTKQKAADLYDAVPIAADRPAQIANTRKTLNDFTAGMDSNPKLGALFQNSRLVNYLDALTPNVQKTPTGLLDRAGAPITRDATEGGSLSWKDLSDFRTRVGDMLDDPKLSEDIATRQLKALYGSLSSDMEATAQEAGPNVHRAWKRANDYYDGRMKRINDTLSMVVGDRQDRTPNEAMGALQATLGNGSRGNAAAFQRVMRSLPVEDAQTVRATIINQARGGAQFDPTRLAKTWGELSERGKSALLPQPGMRSMMDDAASRAADDSANPFAGKSGEAVLNSLETMAQSRGDSARFNQTLNGLSPDEASTVRATLINRLGTANPGAQNAEGSAFSINNFLTRWNKMTPEAKRTLFGKGELRSHMDDLALVAERVKGSERLAGHSNTGAVNSFNATTGGLAGAAVALFSGHPLVAAAAAAPAAYQRLSAEVLTSPRLVQWLTRLPTQAGGAAARAHINRLGAIARTEPNIANNVLHMQSYLRQALEQSPGRAAAAENVGNGGQEPPQQRAQRDAPQAPAPTTPLSSADLLRNLQ